MPGFCWEGPPLRLPPPLTCNPLIIEKEHIKPHSALCLVKLLGGCTATHLLVIPFSVCPFAACATLFALACAPGFMPRFVATTACGTAEARDVS